MAFLNSDVFGGSRMYWVSTVVMACLVLARMPGLVDVALHPERKGVSGFPVPTRALLGVCCTFVAVITTSAMFSGLERATLGNEGLATRTAQNFALAEWINENLDPTDGSVGLFYAGTSFFLPRFEIADFLGKGDERIASTEVKQGAPGHNKWDFGATLEKWDPQVIVPMSSVDPQSPLFRPCRADIALGDMKGLR